MTAERASRVRGADFLVATAASIVAFALAAAVFAPRFLFWEFTDLEPGEYYPSEVKRAIDTLRQFENPWIRIETASNRVINWRLFFPIVGHYLHLPRWAFLSLPALGCLLVLGYVAVLDSARGNGLVLVACLPGVGVAGNHVVVLCLDWLARVL